MRNFPEFFLQTGLSANLDLLRAGLAISLQQTFSGRPEGESEGTQVSLSKLLFTATLRSIRYFLYVQILNFVTKVLILNHPSQQAPKSALTNLETCF